MSVANTNLEEQQMKLHQFLHKFENRRKYNADAHKGASGNSHLQRTPITSRAEAALPKKRVQRPVDSSSELRDPRSELQRKRKQENQLKYSPANLKVDRERMRSAVQVQIRIQKPEEFEMKAEFQEVLSELKQQDNWTVQLDENSNESTAPTIPICSSLPDCPKLSSALDVVPLLSTSPQKELLSPPPAVAKPSPPAPVSSANSSPPSSMVVAADFVLQSDVGVDPQRQMRLFGKVAAAAGLGAVLLFCALGHVGEAADWLLDLVTTVHHEDIFDF